MKLLHREEVEEAGHDMPPGGLCANISEFDLEELKFAGEWILADDENLVGDGQRQNYLYLVITGEVGIFKGNDQGQSQHLASLGPGEAFGEMAFLSGGVASADVQASGECILWRLDHERLLEFIANNGAAGGQLCMNLASVLSGRLLEGNRKVIDIGKQLQTSLHKLQQTEQAGKAQVQAMRQMQGKVKATQFAFKGGSVQKTSFGALGIAATVIAVLSTVLLVISLLMDGGEGGPKVSALENEVDKLTKNEKFYLKAKKNLEGENAELKEERKDLSEENEGLQAQMSGFRGEAERLKEELASASRQPAPVTSPERPAPPSPVAPVRPVTPTPVSTGVDSTNVLAWAARNSTLVFPAMVTARRPIEMKMASGAASTSVPAGKPMKAFRMQGEHLYVSLTTSDKYRAVLPIADSNFMEVVRPKYLAQQHRLSANTPPATSVPQPFLPGRPVKVSPPPAPPAEKPAGPAAGPTGPIVTVGNPQGPQKPADLLDNVRPAPVPDPRKPGTVDTNDHGSACVCKDCRKKKTGGSLFPDL